jgi:hypothetical protein
MGELERWEYSNPETVAIRREKQSCKGCKRLEEVRIFGMKETVCMLGHRIMRKCADYRTIG